MPTTHANALTSSRLTKQRLLQMRLCTRLFTNYSNSKHASQVTFSESQRAAQARFPRRVSSRASQLHRAWYVVQIWHVQR